MYVVASSFLDTTAHPPDFQHPCQRSSQRRFTWRNHIPHRPNKAIDRTGQRFSRKERLHPPFDGINSICHTVLCRFAPYLWENCTRQTDKEDANRPGYLRCSCALRYCRNRPTVRTALRASSNRATLGKGSRTSGFGKTVGSSQLQLFPPGMS